MSKSKIEWTDRTWNPVTGCTKISQGCKNCYAERMYERFNGHGSFKNVICHPERLQQPLKWKQPSLVFVNSMSDLFHEDVPTMFIYEVFQMMARCSQHTFQVLTKRPERMLEFCNQVHWAAKGSLSHVPHAYISFGPLGNPIPIPNVWFGVSVEDQKSADERIPLLLQVPAAVRFLSCEPLLGDINLESYRNGRPANWLYEIDWVICGGESGPAARPMNPAWARSLRDQCHSEAVPFFFKQWGEWVSVSEVAGPGTHFEFPDGRTVRKVGKYRAGNTLDGKQYLEYPKAIACYP